MNTSKLAGVGALGLSLILSACTMSPTVTQTSPTPSGAMMGNETPAMTTEPTAVMIPAGEITGATVIDGKVILIGKNGQYQLMTQEEAMVGSAKVLSSGNVMGKDGSSKPLSEGMVVDMDGKIMAAPSQTIIDAKRKLMIPQNASAAPKPVSGAYQDYAPALLAAAKTGKVVLFFKASWCPECREVDADITKKLDAIPGNVSILKVDYDNSEKLKTKYGVTHQHTFVQVDADGKQLKKWSGSPTLSALLSEII